MLLLLFRCGSPVTPAVEPEPEPAAAAPVAIAHGGVVTWVAPG